MRRICSRAVVLAVVGLTVAGAAPVAAHERWFVENSNRFPIEWWRFGTWPVLLAMGITLAALLGTQVADRAYRRWQRETRGEPQNALVGIGEERLRRVYAYLPLLIAVHTAVPLLVSGFQLQLFAPNLRMETNLLSGLIALGEVLVALALVYGVFTHVAALGLIGLWVAGVVLSPLLGIPAVLLPEHVLFVGIGVFLFIIGRGPFSGDALIGRRAYPNPRLVEYAIPALRWGVGGSFIVLAFTEKLLNPALADAFLQQKINFNLGAGFGLPDWFFIYVAGVVELVAGVLLIAGVLPRLVIIALWVPSNLTLPYLGWVELAGHMPIYGVLLLLLVVGASSRTAARRSALALAQAASDFPTPVANTAPVLAPTANGGKQ